ncbi:MAG TPA: molecular chaperone DnaJ [Anaerolineae bacterium]|nr:molecular chaperone DnaJ [Anaerolineae bacterium]HOQ99089.1 molecular chaperone DnaJ [Anaerolineae bacterium]
MGDNTPDANVIIIYPDFEKLQADVEKLRTELSMLVLERDHLLYHECKDIEMAYMLSIGVLEYKAYEAECAILRLKRKVELIQAKKNRQERIVLSAIEDTLDYEFAAYRAKLDEQIDKMNAALERSNYAIMTDEEARELRKLYRSIVKALHPDMRPDLSHAELGLFYNAVEAYEHGDLQGLRIISAMIAKPAIPDARSDGLAFLTKEKARLTELLQTLRDRIAEIKSEYPYTMKSLVQSPEKIQARKAELEERIEQLNRVLVAYTDRVAEMLR